MSRLGLRHGVGGQKAASIGTTGHFDITSCTTKLGWHGLSISGHGPGVSLSEVQVMIDGTLKTQPLMTHDHPPAGRVVTVKEVESGGPILTVRTDRSPFVDLSFDVSLLGQTVAASGIVVPATAITFSIKLHLPSPFNDYIELRCHLGGGTFGPRARSASTWR